MKKSKTTNKNEIKMNVDVIVWKLKSVKIIILGMLLTVDAS